MIRCIVGAPTFYLIDRQGRLVGRGIGPHVWEGDAAHRLLKALVDAPSER